MAGFEERVSEIFDENPELGRHTPFVIRKIFNLSLKQFDQQMMRMAEDEANIRYAILFHVLFLDYYFDELDNGFMNWVIENYAERFTATELAEMRTQADAHLDFCEVVNVQPGKGTRIRSLISGEENFLRDVSSSRSLNKWDIIMGRFYTFEGDVLSTGPISRFVPAHRNFILKRLQEEAEGRADLTDRESYASFAKEHWDLFFLIEREIREQAAKPEVYTKYGELQLCEIKFKVHNLQAVLDEIEVQDEFNFTGTGKRRDNRKNRKYTRYDFDWLTLGIEEELAELEADIPENAMMSQVSQLDSDNRQIGIDVIGNLYVDQVLCRLETRSAELAEFAVRHFREIFGDAMTFKRIIRKKPDFDAAAAEASGTAEPEETIPAELNHEIIRKYEEEHYRNVLDERLPALNNLTPREARRDPSSMPLLIDWLKGLENLFERNKSRHDSMYLFERIIRDLDLEW